MERSEFDKIMKDYDFHGELLDLAWEHTPANATEDDIRTAAFNTRTAANESFKKLKVIEDALKKIDELEKKFNGY